ncbi:MAG: radical SAM protein [Desulfobacter sp.]|nr:MAG: radical SAM protein [Desulfobacter sp.]
MKVLFVNPACLDKRVTDDDAQQVPIGLYYLAAALLDQGMFATILNLAADHADPLALFRSALDQVKPDIIGFSVTNPSRINAGACARAARKALPNALIVFGGPAPTFMADHLFAACPELDLIVRGEGETSFTALARTAEAGAELDERLDAIPGLIYRSKNGELKDTGPAEPIGDLDRLPHPSKYFTYKHLAMSRGCPGRCTFCGSPKFWGTSEVRRHSPQWFFEEIQALAAKGVTHFFISDDTFTMDREAVAELCSKMIEARLPITWNAISRVDYIDERILPLMRRAGCIQISFGVESGADKIKKILGKPVDNAACARAFDRVKSYGILPRAYFIYGSPGETDATIEESISLMERLAPLSTVFYMLVTFPGTRLYARARDKGWIDEQVWFREIEDLPWCELDPQMDFPQAKAWGDRLRQAFFTNIEEFAEKIELKADPALSPFHADFLSRLALTFSHGEYAQDPRIPHPDKIAAHLFERALEYHPDARAYLGLAMILQKSRQFPAAVARLEKGLTHFPGHKDLCVCMGVSLMNLGEFHRALSCFTPFDSDPGLVHYIDICKKQINS